MPKVACPFMPNKAALPNWQNNGFGCLIQYCRPWLSLRQRSQALLQEEPAPQAMPMRSLLGAALMSCDSWPF